VPCVSDLLTDLKRNVRPRITDKGHEKRFPPPQLDARCSEGTFAKTHRGATIAANRYSILADNSPRLKNRDGRAILLLWNRVGATARRIAESPKSIRGDRVFSRWVVTVLYCGHR
jgi:hypothetical protein